MSEAAMMAQVEASPGGWAWWEARRLRYNLALGAAGLAAYGLLVGTSYALGHPFWPDLQLAFGTTMLLGVGFLILMGAANVCYLAGVLIEGMIAPAEREAFRKRAWAMGLWGSVALPFAFPAVMLSFMI